LVERIAAAGEHERACTLVTDAEQIARSIPDADPAGDPALGVTRTDACADTIRAIVATERPEGGTDDHRSNARPYR
jgi:hypothetical protein